MLGVILSLVSGALAGAVVSVLARRDAFIKKARPAESPPSPPPIVVAETPGAAFEIPVATALLPLVRSLSGPAEEVADPRELSDMPEFKAVLAVMKREDAPLELIKQYVLGANWPAACAGFVALAEREDRQTLCADVVRHLENTRPYVLIYAFRYLLSLDPRPPVGGAVLAAEPWWQHNPVIPGFFRDYFEQAAALGDTPAFGEALKPDRKLDAEPVLGLLDKIDHPFASALRTLLRAWMDGRVDRDFLATVGAVLDPSAGDPLLVEPAEWLTLLDTAEAAVLQQPPRSVLVTGDPRTGKTAFVELLAARLQAQGWTVFAASGVELMAGQIYIGQLEGRIRELIEALNANRKLVWYVPDLAHLADSGAHKGQSASILDQIFPAVAAGRLIVIGETGDKAAARLFQLRPALRALMEIAALQPMAEEAALALALEVCDRIRAHAGLEVPPTTVATAADLAQHYLGASQSPGALLALLKRAAIRTATEGGVSLAPDGVVMTLSQISGLPPAVLDTGQRMELAEIRAFFGRRVIGQNDAVNVLVDRIAMLKAGLIEPGKPIGVFLFAGPTGTGKTELAKTLAEFLFGSPDRIVRLDMSEFQSLESTVKILGYRGDTEGDSLTGRIRKQPFSVVLLDEFEKAHPNCWDLFLQIFDDGRLSDANGGEVDFRHCIIILTSNLGATVHQGGGLGFGRSAGAFSDDQVLRAIGQTFRPEFVNRLDKVVVFQPLSRDLMRGILHKELARVLDRRGLRDRGWAVEWEASAIEFLLDRGFSPEMGARPLKRAIDQHLLAPLAATMVEHRVPKGDQFLFVRSDGARIEVEFVDPNADDAAADLPSPAEPDTDLLLPNVVLRPHGSAAEHAFLGQVWRRVSDELAGDFWRARTDELRLQLADPQIWRRDDRFQVFSTLELVDRIEEAARTAERLFHRHDASRPSRALSGRLALQLYNLGQGMEDLVVEAPVDALLRVESALDTGEDSAEAKAWRLKLYDMYRQWAAKRRMQLREVDAGREAPIFVVTGFGAFRTLKAESGLHLLEEDGIDVARRIAARVVVAPGLDPSPSQAGEPGAMAQRLGAQSVSTAIVRRYQQSPAQMVRDVTGGWRSGRLDLVLGGDFDLIGAAKRLASAA